MKIVLLKMKILRLKSDDFWGDQARGRSHGRRLTSRMTSSPRVTSGQSTDQSSGTGVTENASLPTSTEVRCHALFVLFCTVLYRFHLFLYCFCAKTDDFHITELVSKQLDPSYTLQKLEQWQGNALYRYRCIQRNQKPESWQGAHARSAKDAMTGAEAHALANREPDESNEYNEYNKYNNEDENDGMEENGWTAEEIAEYLVQGSMYRNRIAPFAPDLMY